MTIIQERTERFAKAVKDGKVQEMLDRGYKAHEVAESYNVAESAVYRLMKLDRKRDTNVPLIDKWPDYKVRALCKKW